MSKSTYYFSHDSNARNDEKLLAVRMRFGAEGYGIYFMILERLMESREYMSVKDYNIIAFDFRVSSEKVKSIIEDFGLFVFADDGKHFYSDSFLKRMKPLENLRNQRSEAGKKSAELRKLNPKNKDKLTTVERPFNEISTNKSKEKEIKENNNKTNINEECKTTPSVDFNFEKFILFFNQNRGNMAEVKKLTETRKRKVKSIIREFSKLDIQNVVLKSKNSDFLQGISGKRDWIATFDWVLEKRNFIKILEGNYDNRVKNTINNESTDNTTIGRASLDTLKRNAEYTGSY